MRSDEWQPDAAALSVLDELGVPLVFFLNPDGVESRTVEARQVRDSRTRI